MALVEGPVAPDVIHSTRGVLDYAVWRGVPYVRKWPRKPLLPRNPNVKATATAFAHLSRALQATPKELQNQYTQRTHSNLWTWKDLATSAAFGNAIRW